MPDWVSNLLSGSIPKLISLIAGAIAILGTLWTFIRIVSRLLRNRCSESKISNWCNQLGYDPETVRLELDPQVFFRWKSKIVDFQPIALCSSYLASSNDCQQIVDKVLILLAFTFRKTCQVRKT